MKQTLLFFAFALALCLEAQAQVNNIVLNAGVAYTNGAPTFRPGGKGSRIAIDTVTWIWYESLDNNTGNWIESGYRVQPISGCVAPAYTPNKHQSVLVINGCDSLYYYRAGAWRHINPPGVSGVAWGDITGDITNQTDLQTALSDKADAAHNHALSDVLQSGATSGQVPKWNGLAWVPATDDNTGTTYTTGIGIAISGGNVISNTGDLSNTNEIELPAQAGNSGKYLTTNGTAPSWATVSGGITGSGTTNYLPKWASSSTQDASALYQASTKVMGFGTATPSEMPGWGGGQSFHIYDPAGLPNIHLSTASGNYGGYGLDNSRLFYFSKKGANFVYNNGGAGELNPMRFINKTGGTSIIIAESGGGDYRWAFGKNASIVAGVDVALIGSTADNSFYTTKCINSSGVVLSGIRNDGKVEHLATNTAAGTTGAQTINKPSGTVNFAASATSLVVTNSLCTTSSIVFAVVRTNDSTAQIKNVVPGAGSFTINLTAAATAETSVGFFIIN